MGNIRESSMSRELALGQEYGYIIVSACRGDWSGDEKENKRINKQKTKELMGLIQSYGYSYVPVMGGFREKGIGEVLEDSFFILNYDRNIKGKGDISDLWDFGVLVCKKFNQDSFLFYDPKEGKPYYADKYGKADDYKFGTIIFNAPTSSDKPFFTSFKKGGGGYDPETGKFGKSDSRFRFEKRNRISRSKLTEKLVGWSALPVIQKEVTGYLSKFALGRVSSYINAEEMRIKSDRKNVYQTIGSIVAYCDVPQTLFKGIPSYDNSDPIFDIWLSYERELRDGFREYDYFEASITTGEFLALAKELGVADWVAKDVMSLYRDAQKDTKDYLSVDLVFGIRDYDFKNIMDTDSLVKSFNGEVVDRNLMMLETSNVDIYCSYDISGSRAGSDDNIFYGDGYLDFVPAGTIGKPQVDLGRELKKLGVNVK